MRQIVLDTETTGLSPQENDRVVEIGCVELLHRRATGSYFHRYINPERDMPQAAFQIHGLSSAFLADKAKFAEIAQEFLDFVDSSEIIIHNASFDLAFLDAELQRAGLLALSTHTQVVDTLSLARSLFPGRRASLDILCDRLHIDRSGRSLHGALLDAQLLAEVYIALTRGQDSLLEGDSGAKSSYLNSERALTTNPITAAKYEVVLQPALAEDLTAFEAMLAYLDKESNGKTLWRQWLSTDTKVQSADATR